MARDLIGPALPPGFKEHATVEDEERDPSPGKQQRASALPGRTGDHRGVGAVRPGGKAGQRLSVWDPIIVKMTIQSQFAIITNRTVLTDQSSSGRLFNPSINCIRKDDGWCMCYK
jgi:hypothetical protein